jgi:hypothetical protein
MLRVHASSHPAETCGGDERQESKTPWIERLKKGETGGDQSLGTEREAGRPGGLEA